MINNRVLYGVLSCILILQAGCLRGNVKNEPVPVSISSLKTEPVPVSINSLQTQPVGCEDDPLDFYNAMPVLDDTNTVAKADNSLRDEIYSEDCLKLRKAIKLSIPGSKIQNDEEAVSLLNELKKNSSLVGRDLKFTLLLLQHVSQRQQLRQIIADQEKRRIKNEKKNSALKTQLDTLQSQLDQLKNIEIEIDKKERSVISPIGE